MTRERIRVAGHPLPKNAYRLSQTGWQSADELRLRLASQVVTVRAPNLAPLSVRVAEVPSLASAQLDLTGTLSSTRKGRLDLTRPAAATRNRGPVVWGNGLRRIDRFFGRTEELRALDAWWVSDSLALFVTGLAGIGKSALAAAWIQGRRLRVPVYGFETRPSSTAAGLLADFGGFLAALGKPALAAHLSLGVPLDSAFVSRLLERDLADVRILIVVDNAEQASRDLARLIGSLFGAVDQRLRAKVLLLGRRPPRWLWASTGTVMGPEILHLRGLDPEASMALLRHRGLRPDSAAAREIVRGTRGHPLLLHLAVSTGTGRGAVVQRYLAEEVWGSLSKTDRAVLEAASVFRKAVSEHVLEAVAETGRPALESLVNRNLLERTIAGGYVMHDLVREFVTAQVPAARCRVLHSRAAERLLHAADSRERWEGIYHLLKAGRTAEAAALLDSKDTPLLDSVAAEDVALLVHGLTFDESQAGIYCVFAEILGDSLHLRGHIGPALFQYGHARQLAEGSHRADRVPRLLRKMAFLERCRSHYPRALGYLVEAGAQLGNNGASAERAEILREMALVEQAMGRLTAAAKHLGEAVDVATEMSDRAALSRSMLALGSLEALRGRRELGLDSQLEGLRVAEQSGNLTEIARASIVVGTGLVDIGRIPDSLTHYNRGLELARLLGNLRLVAYATMDRSAALIDMGRYQEAGIDLREAQGAFRILEEEETLALLKVYEGNRQMGMGRVTSAKRIWRLAFEELRRQGSKIDLLRGLADVGMLCAARSEPGEGAAYLIEAKGLAEELGNSTLLSEIEATLSRLGASVVSAR